MIPGKWAWLCVLSAWGCEGGATKVKTGAAEEEDRARAAALARLSVDAVALAEEAGCEEGEVEGWCAASRGEEGALPKPGAPVLGLRARVMGPRVEFTDEVWVWAVAGEGARARAGWREVEGLEPRVRKGLVKQLTEATRGEREEVVMESRAVAAALRAPAGALEPVSRQGRVWRVGGATLWRVGEGRWMSREEASDGAGVWTQWVRVKLTEPAPKGDAPGEVPLEKMRARYGCGGEVEGVKAKACEVLAGYAGAQGVSAEGRYTGWYVRPAGGEEGAWSARFEGGAASLAQEGLEASQAVALEGGRFEVKGAFEGRESEPVVVWTRGGWAIARSRVSGVVWMGRLEPVEE